MTTRLACGSRGLLADVQAYLAILDSDPDDAAALAGLVDAAAIRVDAGAFAKAKQAQRERGSVVGIAVEDREICLDVRHQLPGSSMLAALAAA